MNTIPDTAVQDFSVEFMMQDLNEEKIILCHEKFQAFAEMSPNAFLNALENELLPNRSLMEFMIRSENGIAADIGFYPNLLQALELLAWNPEYLKRVVVILAEMTPYWFDSPFKRPYRGPYSTLVKLLRWFRPQTYANERERTEIFDMLIDEYSEAAWFIIMEQIRVYMNFDRISNSKPDWNGCADSDRDPSIQRFDSFYLHCLDTGINWLEHNKETLNDLLPQLNHRDGDRKAERTDEIWNVIIAWGITADDRDRVWLRDRIRISTGTESKSAREALWVLTPEDPCLDHLWLFSKFDVPGTWDQYDSGWYDFDAIQDEGREKRRQAIKEIYRQKGIDGIIRFCGMIGSVMQTRILGFMAAEIINEPDVEKLILKIVEDEKLAGDDRYVDFIFGFASNIKDFNRKHLQRMFDDSKDSIGVSGRAVLLTLFPLNETVLGMLENDLELEREFWNSFRSANEGSIGRVPVETVEFAAGKLLEFNRPYDAFLVACIEAPGDADKFPNVKPATLHGILRAMPDCAKPDTFNYMERHGFPDAIDMLNAYFSQSELAVLEYLHLMHFYDADDQRFPMNLSKEIPENPAMFCDAVCHLTKEGNSWKDYVSAGFKFIQLPSDMFSDQKKLNDWIEKVMHIADTKPEKDMIDYQTGSQLGRILMDERFNPRTEVVEAIQDQNSNKAFMAGVRTGYDNRGYCMNGKSIAACLNRASDFERHAENYEDAFPEVAGLLRCFADNLKTRVERHKALGRSI